MAPGVLQLGEPVPDGRHVGQNIDQVAAAWAREPRRYSSVRATRSSSAARSPSRCWRNSAPSAIAGGAAAYSTAVPWIGAGPGDDQAASGQRGQQLAYRRRILSQISGDLVGTGLTAGDESPSSAVPKAQATLVAQSAAQRTRVVPVGAGGSALADIGAGPLPYPTISGCHRCVGRRSRPR